LSRWNKNQYFSQNITSLENVAQGENEKI